MKKVVFLITIIFLLCCGCANKNNNDVINSFERKVNSAKNYSITGTMDIISNEDTYTYDVTVDYQYENYYKVTLINKINDHEQVILKNDDGVFV